MFDIERQSRFAFILVMAVLGWATVAGPVAAADASSANAFELGEAPRRDVPQDDVPRDTSGLLLGSPIGTAATTRDTVVQLYNNVYLPGNAVTLVWTGSIASCDPGTTNVAHQQAVIDRANYFRALVQLPPVSLLSGTRTTQAQAAALMMSANNMLSHTPPMSWLCYTADGATGASVSNLSLGINGVGAIDGYMADPGAGNTAAGHRRWILYPPQGSLATGDVPSSGPLNPASNDLVVLDVASWTTRPATPVGIAWPPAGFVPYQNLPSVSNRWSFSFPGADFSSATVTMTGPGGSIPVTLETVQNGFGDNTIVFRPTGVSYANPVVDTSYTILVSGMTGGGVPASIQYTVTVIDPNSIASPTLASAVSRKVHGAAGTFDLPLSMMSTNPTTEPRQSSTATIVMTFDAAIISANVAVTEGTATAGSLTFSGNDVIVPLTGVTDQQYVTISLTNVSSTVSTGGSGSIRLGFLVGDVNQNRVVTLADLGLVNAQLAQVVTAANYLKDVNASGTLTVADKGITNANLTRALPVP